MAVARRLMDRTLIEEEESYISFADTCTVMDMQSFLST